jgi:hypothetical protein
MGAISYAIMELAAQLADNAGFRGSLPVGCLITKQVCHNPPASTLRRRSGLSELSLNDGEQMSKYAFRKEVHHGQVVNIIGSYRRGYTS